MRYSIVAIFCVLMAVGCKEKATTPGTTDNAGTGMVDPGKNPYVNLDQSPMDMVYYPVEYPLHKMNNEVTEPPVARVIYSRPHRKGREIFGTDSLSLCRYGEEWRLGANEATEIDFYKAVNIANTNIPAGRYIMYCIPREDSWTIVLNSNLDTWGLHMDPSKDIVRIELPAKVQDPEIEDFTMVFLPAADGATLLMSWDKVKVELPIKFM